MLVLNRKENEEIQIGNNIVVKVISTTEGTVKLGIEAPKEMPILRAELYQNIKNNVIEASRESSNKFTETGKMIINKLKDQDDG